MSALRIIPVVVTPLRQNCAIISCVATGETAVIDPGGDVPKILDALEKAGLQDRVVKIFLTHGHFDHAGGVADLVEALDVPVEGPHEEDAYLLSDLENIAQQFGVTNAKNAWSDRYLSEGDVVTLGACSFHVFHVPGHSPGSVVYVNHKALTAWVGDTLFENSIGRTDFPKGDQNLLIQGIKTKILTLPDETVCLPGHGPTTSVAREKKTNPFFKDFF